jgi:hypothetical protein
VDSEEKGRSWLDVDVLGRAICERLLMAADEMSKSVLLKSKQSGSHRVTEPKVVAYLSECYFRYVSGANLMDPFMPGNSSFIL